MSDAYNRAIEDIYSFGRPNKTVETIIATRIITLTKGGERDPDRLCDRALAACGFTMDRARKQKNGAVAIGLKVERNARLPETLVSMRFARAFLVVFQSHQCGYFWYLQFSEQWQFTSFAMLAGSGP